MRNSIVTGKSGKGRCAWLAAGLITMSASLGAQGRGPDKVPPGHIPPPGMCRVWFDGRPPGQQPRPTDCATAARDAERTGGRVVFGAPKKGGDKPNKGKDKPSKGKPGGGSNETPPISRDQYPATLPDMTWGAAYGQGQHRDEVRRWVGSGDVRAQLIDVAPNGLPALVVWYDSRGRTVQRWIDDDRDGRADRVELFQNGQSVGVIR